MTTSELLLTAGFDRNLVWAEGGSVRYLVAKLEVQTAELQSRVERGPLNIALSIDASGSMSGGKLEAAKLASLGLLDRLNSRDRLTVVSFASDVVTHLRAAAMDDAGKRKARSAIGELSTRGMTNLSGGWFAAADAAAEAAEHDASLTPRVVILSDGQANEGITDVEALAHHAGELRKRGVVTSTVGIGDGYDEALLAAIAENGGGRLHDAERTDEIGDVLLGEIGEAMAQLADGALLVLDLPAGIRAEPLGISGAEITAGQVTLPLGGLSAGLARTAVVRLTCPSGQLAANLEVRVSATAIFSATGDRLRAAPTDCGLAFARGSENSAQTRDVERSLAAARAWHAHVVRYAALLNRDAEGDEAEKYLSREIKHFERYARDLPGGAEMIAELELIRSRAGRRWTERTRKEMVLQASMSLREGTDHRGAARASWSAYVEKEPEA